LKAPGANELKDSIIGRGAALIFKKGVYEQHLVWLIHLQLADFPVREYSVHTGEKKSVLTFKMICAVSGV
jgi:hypothetical protein